MCEEFEGLIGVIVRQRWYYILYSHVCIGVDACILCFAFVNNCIWWCLKGGLGKNLRDLHVIINVGKSIHLTNIPYISILMMYAHDV